MWSGGGMFEEGRKKESNGEDEEARSSNGNEVESGCWAKKSGSKV